MYRGLDYMIEQNFSFAIFRYPDQPNPTLIVGKDKIVDSFKGVEHLKGFIISPFNLNEHPVRIILPEQILDGSKGIANYLSQFYSEIDKNTLSGSVSGTLNDNFDLYKQIFPKFSSALSTHKFQKLVLSRYADFTPSSPVKISTLFQKALLSQDSFVYLYHTPTTGTWLGITPELFLRGHGNHWETVALAGTRKSGNLSTIWDQKNIQEQQYVTDYICGTLNEMEYIVQPSTPKTIKAGDVEHIKTQISFEIPSDRIFNLGILLEKLHPTPAVCGLPKEEAMKFISENEEYDRSYYSGFIGILDKDKGTDLFVNLRCMNSITNRLRLFVGGGILEASNLESEWQETKIKMETMLSLLK